jgi:hypothetical protein
LESLDIKQKEIQKDIDNDEELKKLSDSIRFMESVSTGETIIENI